MLKRPAIERLLRPRTVAVLGASSTPGSLGASVLSNLDRFGFAGEIYPINPKRDRIGERRCLPSAAALPLGVDVAVLAIPSAGVLDRFRQLKFLVGRPRAQPAHYQVFRAVPNNLIPYEDAPESNDQLSRQIEPTTKRL